MSTPIHHAEKKSPDLSAALQVSPQRRLFHFVLRHKRMALLQLTLAVMGTLLMPIFPGVTQWFFDDIIPNRRTDMVAMAALLLFAGFAGQEILFYFRTRVNSAFEQRMVFDLRGQLHRKIARMRMGWFDTQSTGDVLTRMADDVPATQRVVLEGIEQGVTAILQIIMATAMMFHTNAALTWIVLIPTPFLAAGGWIYARLLSPRAMQAREATSAMNAMLFDTIAGIRQIKSYTFEEPQQEQFNTSSRHLQKVQNKLMAAAALYSPLMSLIGKLGLVLIMFVGASWCMQNPTELSAMHLTQGELFAFVLLVAMLYEPIARLHGVNQMMVNGLASAKRVFAVLDEAGEENLEAGLTLKQLEGDVVFDKVSFGYSPSRPVIHAIDLHVKPQQTVAFVGATGSGKSTLFQLLSRFYDPDNGHIYVDGKPLTQYSKASVRNAIAYVTQDAFLFATTIRQNLLLGKPSASEEELEHALQLACADEFVRRLPEGLDSEVGERGSRFSGGERQRLSMARAFLKNAPILLLDEATSAVDNKSEHLIQESLRKLRQNRTCLVIAHRLSTVIEADRIYVMRLGEIVDSGTHTELLESSPYYAELAALAFDSQKRPD